MPDYGPGIEGAHAMRWFQKDRPPDIWEIAGDPPLGDIAAAQRIREICTAAAAIAGNMAALRGRKAEAAKAVEAERYQAAVKVALEIASKISDDAMRDVSVSQIIRLSVKAGHLKTARILLRAVRSEKNRAELVAAHTELLDQDAAS